MQEGSEDIKQDFEILIHGGVIKVQIDEQIVFSQLNENESSIFSLLLASGYLKVKNHEMLRFGRQSYELTLTNQEVMIMFRNMIRDWFQKSASAYNAFIKALLVNDVEAMNTYMNKVALSTFRYFDTGNHPSDQSEPERFYHWFLLRLMVELSDRYDITSNRESGFGRYDIMMEPKEKDTLL